MNYNKSITLNLMAFLHKSNTKPHSALTFDVIHCQPDGLIQLFVNEFRMLTVTKIYKIQMMSENFICFIYRESYPIKCSSTQITL